MRKLCHILVRHLSASNLDSIGRFGFFTAKLNCFLTLFLEFIVFYESWRPISLECISLCLVHFFGDHKGSIKLLRDKLGVLHCGAYLSVN